MREATLATDSICSLGLVFHKTLVKATWEKSENKLFEKPLVPLFVLLLKESTIQF